LIAFRFNFNELFHKTLRSTAPSILVSRIDDLLVSIFIIGGGWAKEIALRGIPPLLLKKKAGRTIAFHLSWSKICARTSFIRQWQ